MYLCICNAIREGDVEAVLRERGARTVGDVYRHLGKTPQCGSCASEIRERVQQQARSLGTTALIAAE